MKCEGVVFSDSPHRDLNYAVYLDALNKNMKGEFLKNRSICYERMALYTPRTRQPLPKAPNWQLTRNISVIERPLVDSRLPG